MRVTSWIIVLVAAATFGGAVSPTQAFDWKNWTGAGPAKLQESRYRAPTKMAVIWTPAVLNQAGQVPTRGFGGRVYFYDAKNNAISVEGQLVVYGYDDTVPGGNGKPPDRKFAFTPEQFSQHYSPTQLGAAYSIWIPWDAVGQPQMEISLVPVFTAASGQLVMGQPSHILLPGPTTTPAQTQIMQGEVPLQYGPLNPNDAATRRDFGIQKAAYEQLAFQQAQFQQAQLQQAQLQQQFQHAGPGQIALSPPQGSLGVETMSINLPGTMAEQLSHAPRQMSPVDKLNQYRAAAKAPPMMPPTAPQLPAATVLRPGQAAAPPVSPRPAGYQPPKPPAPTAPGPSQAGGPPPSLPFRGAQPFVLPTSPQ